MKHFKFNSIAIILFMVIALTNVEAQLTKTVNALGNVVTYSGTYLDSATTYTPAEGFSLGNFYDFTNYPVNYVVKIDTNSSFGTAAQLPKVTLYVDISYDNTNWILKADTLFTNDSLVTRYRGTTNFSDIDALYYRPAIYTGEGRDSIDVQVDFYFKKD